MRRQSSRKRSGGEYTEAGFDLTQSECNVAANINKVTASPSGSLFINSTAVTGDSRAKVVKNIPGKWSFAYARREIIEPPSPANTTAFLSVEQIKVNEFFDKFFQKSAVNGFIPADRSATRSQLLSAWGKARGSDGEGYLVDPHIGSKKPLIQCGGTIPLSWRGEEKSG